MELIGSLDTQTHFIADGTTTIWNFNFADGYISPNFVKAYHRDADGVRTELVVNPETDLIGPFQLRITPAVPAGHTLVIYRATKRDGPLVDFTDGARLSEENLDTVARQGVHLAAESGDYFGATTESDLVTLGQDAALAAAAAASSAELAEASADAAALDSAEAVVAADAAAASAVAAAGAASALASDLSSSTGSAMVGHLSAGPSAVARTVRDTLRDRLSVKDFGAVGNGQSHPLSSITTINGQSTIGWTLAQWQAVYPHALALTDEIDWCAIQAALNWLNPTGYVPGSGFTQGGGTAHAPQGTYLCNRPIYIPPYTTLYGDGRDGWTGFQPLVKPNGTNLVWTGAATETCFINSLNVNTTTGAIWQADNLALITTADLDNQVWSFCHNAGLRHIGIHCENGTQVGVRLQGAALSKGDEVSVMGFKTAMMAANCWDCEWTRMFLLGTQISYYGSANNAVELSGVFDCLGWNNSNVTVGNKPPWWDANDTIYRPTSLYIVASNGFNVLNGTAQHTGRALFQRDSGVSIEFIYIEDLPFTGGGDSDGAFNGYSATANSSNSLFIEHLFCSSNGVTLFNNLANTPITCMQFGGVQGKTLGAAISGSTNLVTGNNFRRNGAFPDTTFNTKIINLVPERGTFVPALNNIGGTVNSNVGIWWRRGNLFDVVVIIGGVGLTATGGGASFVDMPFNGSGGVPGLAANAAAACATSPPQNVGAGFFRASAARLFTPTITSTTDIVLSFTGMAA